MDTEVSVSASRSDCISQQQVNNIGNYGSGELG